MFDFRPFIAYLTAGFLGLTLGMVIGMSLVAPDQVSRQAKQIADLKVQVTGAEQAKDQLDKMEDSLDSLRPGLVSGKLSGKVAGKAVGKRIVIIQTGDYPEATQAAASAIHDAGGVVAASVVINEKINELTPQQRSDLEQALPGGNAGGSDPPAPDADNTQIIYAVADAVAEGTGTSQANKHAIETLESQGLVTMTGDLSPPALLCVLVGGGKDDTSSGVVNTEARKPVDGVLIDRLRESSGGLIRIVGCEPFYAVYPSIPLYQKYSIPTVDCIDHPLGALDLPFALRGETTANYGLGKTATRRVPESLEEAVSP